MNFEKKAKKVEVKKVDKLKLVVEALASVHEAYDQTPRGTFTEGELERIAKELLEKLS